MFIQVYAGQLAFKPLSCIRKNFNYPQWKATCSFLIPVPFHKNSFQNFYFSVIRSSLWNTFSYITMQLYQQILYLWIQLLKSDNLIVMNKLLYEKRCRYYFPSVTVAMQCWRNWLYCDENCNYLHTMDREGLNTANKNSSIKEECFAFKWGRLLVVLLTHAHTFAREQECFMHHIHR